MSAKRLTVLGGDGIGPEVADAAVRVLAHVAESRGHALAMTWHAVGHGALVSSGDPLPSGTLQACRGADAVLLGAIGGPAVDGQRPEEGLLRLRKELGLFANLRPIRVWPGLEDASPLKPDRLLGVDILFVRELAGGLYYGERELTEARARDTCDYTREAIERIARVAGSAARRRSGRVASVDKANVLATGALWRSVVTRVFEQEFPEVTLEHVLVDAMAMHLLQRPRDFDVILTENTFGDILSDEASVLSGSLGMLPSASMGAPGPPLFEPVHGTAPDIAGLDRANPVGAILSAALLAEHALGWSDVALTIEEAVEAALASGARTLDLDPSGGVTASAFTELVLLRCG